MMLILASLFFLPTAIFGQKCDEGWSYFDQYCYKHFYNVAEYLTYPEAESKCVAYGGHLTPMYNEESLAFLGNLTKLPGDAYYSLYDMPRIGIMKDHNLNWVYPYDPKTPPYHKMCEGFDGIWYSCFYLVVDNIYNAEINYRRKGGAPCLINGNCNWKLSRYICRIPQKKVECKKAHTENVDGKCVCEKGYMDITETDVPERRKYEKGDKCIPKDPCREVKDFTVNFIVDSSESIGSSNWKSLVEFLKSGADFLPNTTRVGFVKYSTNVTFSKFLEPGWSQRKFRNFVPSEYENGGTNTAEALDMARKMFKDDSNKNQVAVLITDGLPFVDGLSLKEVLHKTKKSAEKLRSNRINLIALGYGESLYRDGHKYIQEWLEDPEEDYFGYDKLACDFKQLHMSILLRKVCRRYVKN